MSKIGAGFNPKVPSGDISYPTFVSMAEGGIEDISALREYGFDGELSLHLARSPICETSENQDEYISTLKSTFDLSGLVSVGFHVTGERGEGIGRYGFSSQYDPSQKYEDRAVRFVSEVKSRLGLDVWLENANFYSSNPKSVFAAAYSTNRIAERTDSSLIADITHLYINANNVSIENNSYFGAICWERVIEVHLAGMIRGRDGAIHDGHSETINEELWGAMDMLSHSGLLNGARYLTLEHTDPVWCTKPDVFAADFGKLQAFAAAVRERKSEGVDYSADQDRYAVGYIKRKLIQGLPDIEAHLNDKGQNFDEVVDRWIASRVLDGEVVLTMSLAEEKFVPSNTHARYFGPDFVAYLNEQGLAERSA